MMDGDHAQRDDDDRDAAAADGPRAAGHADGDDAHVPLPWESDDDAPAVNASSDAGVIDVAGDERTTAAALPQAAPSAVEAAAAAAPESADAIPSHESPADAAPADEADLPLVELTLDRTAEAPTELESIEAAGVVEAESLPAAEPPTDPQDDIAAAVFLAEDAAPPTAVAPPAEAPTAEAPAAVVDDAAYSPLGDTLTCQVVQQHLAPEPAPRRVAEASAAPDALDSAGDAQGDANETFAADSDVCDAAARPADGLVFEPLAPAELTVPAFVEPEPEPASAAAAPAGPESGPVAPARESEFELTAAVEAPPTGAAPTPPSFDAESNDELRYPVAPAASAVSVDHFDMNVDAVTDDPRPAEPVPVAADEALSDEPCLAAASAPIMTYADATTPAEDEALDAEADDIDPEPEPVDAAPVSGGMWTIPMLCLGIAVIACCVLIPQADYNRRLVYEHEKLRRDADAITEQVKVNDEFLRKVADDPSLAERLAQRQMKIIRQGTRVLDLKSGDRDETEMSPYHLVTVPAPDPLPPFRPKGGALTQACLNPHTRLYLIGGALVLMAAGLVLGYAPKRD